MLKGLGQLGDMAKMMKSAKELQERMVAMQAELEELETTGESGAGLVTARVTLKGQLRGLNIDASIFRPEDKEVAEDLIIAAITDAQARAKAEAERKMAELTEGMGLPAGLNLPF